MNANSRTTKQTHRNISHTTTLVTKQRLERLQGEIHQVNKTNTRSALKSDLRVLFSIASLCGSPLRFAQELRAVHSTIELILTSIPSHFLTLAFQYMGKLINTHILKA